MKVHWDCVLVLDASVGRHTDTHTVHTDRQSYLRPGCGEPFGAGSLEAGGAALWLVVLVTAAVWKLFEHTTLQPSTHHLTLTQAASTCSITLAHTYTTNTQTRTLIQACVFRLTLTFADLKETHIPLKVHHTYMDWFFKCSGYMQVSWS